MITFYFSLFLMAIRNFFKKHKKSYWSQTFDSTVCSIAWSIAWLYSSLKIILILDFWKSASPGLLQSAGSTNRPMWSRQARALKRFPCPHSLFFLWARQPWTAFWLWWETPWMKGWPAMFFAGVSKQGDQGPWGWVWNSEQGQASFSRRGNDSSCWHLQRFLLRPESLNGRGPWMVRVLSENILIIRIVYGSTCYLSEIGNECANFHSLDTGWICSRTWSYIHLCRAHDIPSPGRASVQPTSHSLSYLLENHPHQHTWPLKTWQRGKTC